MQNLVCSTFLALLLCLAGAGSMTAEEKPQEAKAAPATAQNAGAPAAAPNTTPPNPLPREATTVHELRLPDRVLRFKATAGAIRLSDAQSGTAQADVGYIAFQLEGTDPASRPVTFAVNGGPGASSAWLNLGSLGPWRLPLGGAVSPSTAPVVLDNAETWLDFTDLVFIDPPGTGYSRILAQGDEIRRSFYSIGGDIDLLTVVVRKWLSANQRLVSPKFIVGESYGGFRAPKLARQLQDREGIAIKGLILVSPVLDFNWFEGQNNPLPAVTRLPSQAAAARGIKGDKGRAALADVEAYAVGPYLVDLLHGERDPQVLASMSDKVAGFIGLSPTLVRRYGGRIDLGTFARERARADGKVASVYDATVTGFDPEPRAAASDYSDPVLDAMKSPLATAMADLTANRLKWPVEARYEILNESVNRQWDWGRGRSHPEALGDLKKGLALDPELSVLIAHGITDQVTPYFASKLLIDQIPSYGNGDRLRLAVYGGGHMLYADDDSRRAFKADARLLIERQQTEKSIGRSVVSP
jgi:carboxypeptidase C (cathepsin A)